MSGFDAHMWNTELGSSDEAQGWLKVEVKLKCVEKGEETWFSRALKASGGPPNVLVRPKEATLEHSSVSSREDKEQQVGIRFIRCFNVV